MSSGLVLLYHRVADLESDPQLLAATPDRFAQHLEVLRHDCHPMSLTELMTGQRDRRLPRRAVAVTFDDGYADGASAAEPLLAQHGIPATIFVASDYLGGAREFWWDELERLVLLPGWLPETIRLQIGVSLHRWDLDGSATYRESDYRRHVSWNVECAQDPSRRHTLYRALCRLLRTTIGREREAVLDALTAMSAATRTARPTHCALTEEALVRLGQSPLVEVGAHTSTHPVLAGLPVNAQRVEIAGSKARLENITGRTVTSFAYPFGGRSDYTSTTVALVRESGFATGCSNIPGLVRHRTDPFQVPRVLVRNWDAGTFAARLREWFRD